MKSNKWHVGYPDKTGIAGGRTQKTSITAFDEESGIFISILDIPVSDHYDCTELAQFIVDTYNNEETVKGDFHITGR